MKLIRRHFLLLSLLYVVGLAVVGYTNHAHVYNRDVEIINPSLATAIVKGISATSSHGGILFTHPPIVFLIPQLPCEPPDQVLSRFQSPSINSCAFRLFESIPTGLSPPFAFVS
jgi:hypothetical protein